MGPALYTYPRLATESHSKLVPVNLFKSIPRRHRESSDYSLTKTIEESLQALKGVLVDPNMPPCVKQIATMGVKVLGIVRELQANRHAIGKLGLRASNVAIAVARACTDTQGTPSPVLESHLKQIIGMMDQVLKFLSEITSRPGYKNLWFGTQDASATKALKTQVRHAFEAFQVGEWLYSAPPLDDYLQQHAEPDIKLHTVTARSAHTSRSPVPKRDTPY